MSNFSPKMLFEITPEITHLAELCEESNAIDKELYGIYDVKRGLRDMHGKGVLAGLTNVSDVRAKKIVDGEEVPCAGNLYFRRKKNWRIFGRCWQTGEPFRRILSET